MAITNETVATQATNNETAVKSTAASKSVLELLLGNAALALTVDIGATVLLSSTTPSKEKLLTNFLVSTGVYIIRDVAKMYEHAYVAAALGGGIKYYLLKESTGIWSTLKNVGIGAVTTSMYAHSGLTLPPELDAASPAFVETFEAYLLGAFSAKDAILGSVVATGLVGIYIAVHSGAKSLANVAVEDVALKVHGYYDYIANKSLASVWVKDIVPTNECVANCTELCSAIVPSYAEAE